MSCLSSLFEGAISYCIWSVNLWLIVVEIQLIDVGFG